MGLAHFVAFANRGMSSPDFPEATTRLGVNIDGRPRNGMQLHYRLTDYDSVFRVRWRRVIVNEAAWDYDPRSRRTFQPFYRNARQDDHPPAWTQPFPDLYDIDTPGFSHALCLQRTVPMTPATLLGPAAHGRPSGVSRAGAEEIIWVMNFVQWVEVAFAAEDYRRESDVFAWSNVLRVKWNGHSWIGAPGSLIERGHRLVPQGDLDPVLLGIVV